MFDKEGVQMKESTKLSDYEDIIVVDRNGVIIFYDMANVSLFDLKPEDIIGNKITSIYRNLDEDNSTLMLSAKKGISICNYKQELKTIKNNIVYQICSTYPIMDNNKPVGAIEFSKFLYPKDSINWTDSHSTHKSYRKNNTIYTIDDIVTVNSRMNSIKEKIRKSSATDSSVLVYGATGTGKEMVAQAIHNCSKRRSQPFISLNCAAIPENLIESVLFGTVKGSYTDAENKSGLFEAANHGTLFLDELNSMELSMQVKLLKAIEEKHIRRVGGIEYIDLDVRIIAAINEEPDKLIDEGRLREDLFYRISVVLINLPLLKERKEDIEVLTRDFINYYNERLDMSIKGVSPEVISLFNKYDWPGNVRELKNIIEGAYNSVDGDIIGINDLSERLLRKALRRDLEMQNISNINLKDYMDECEKRIILQMLNSCNGNAAEAARRLKISKQLLQYKMKTLIK